MPNEVLLYIVIIGAISGLGSFVLGFIAGRRTAEWPSVEEMKNRIVEKGQRSILNSLDRQKLDRDLTKRIWGGRPGPPPPSSGSGVHRAPALEPAPPTDEGGIRSI